MTTRAHVQRARVSFNATQHARTTRAQHETTTTMIERIKQQIDDLIDVARYEYTYARHNARVIMSCLNNICTCNTNTCTRCECIHAHTCAHTIRVNNARQIVRNIRACRRALRVLCAQIDDDTQRATFDVDTLCEYNY